MLDLVEVWIIFMKQQDLVLQLMRNGNLYFVHLRKGPPEGANSESCAAFSGNKIKATITQWPSSVPPPGCAWTFTWVPHEVWYLWLYHSAFNLQITLENGGKSGWKYVTGSSNMHSLVPDLLLGLAFQSLCCSPSSGSDSIFWLIPFWYFSKQTCQEARLQGNIISNDWDQFTGNSERLGSSRPSSCPQCWSLPWNELFLERRYAEHFCSYTQNKGI